MNEKIYSITLADGTVLNELHLNGDNFISEEAIDPSIFEGNCSPVVISDGENEDVHSNMAYVPVSQFVRGEYWFVLRDLSEAELKDMQTQANIEYIAMMTGVEL